MSTSIETRVVQMKFDNKDFEAGVKQTLTSLASLKKGLTMEGAAKGLHDVASAAKNFTLEHISAGVEGLANKFRTLSIVGITALQNITNQAIYAGQNLVKSLTISPIKSGLEEYETNLNSIQTILANTAWQHTGLKDVNAALKQLNDYSDQTIYNFSEMARNIGTFTAAGVKLDVATAAIKGISNLAAISGSNAQQASTAMYQLSQALAAGKVTLMDWNSVVNAGMGGKVFQDALMETARIHGVAIDKMVKDAGGFRNTLENGWLTGKVLTETLSKFTGDLNEKQLKTMGYSKQQIKQILEMGKTAQEAATKVKTFSALIDTLQESVGSGWAQTWQILFGDFEEARTLFTSINNVLGDWIKGSADARNKVLGDWKAMNGRKVLIEALKNVFEALISVVKPIKEAFREIFPAATGRDLAHWTYLFRDFTEKLKIGSKTAKDLKRTFAGVFAIFGIAFDLVKAAAGALFDLIGFANKGSGSFLNFTAKIGDFLVNLRKAIQDGKVFETIFGVIGNVLKGALQIVIRIGRAIGDLFNKFDSDKAGKNIDKLGDKLEPLSGVTGVIAKGWTKVLDVLEKVMKFITNVVFSTVDSLGNIGSWIKDAFGSLSIDQLIGGVAVGGFGVLIAKVIGFFTGSGPAGLLDQVKETIDSVTGAFESMQNTLRAATLIQIAIALGVLTLSVLALSKIDSEGLTRALTAMTVMFAQLGGSLYLFEKHLKFDDIGKMYAIAGAMVILGIAIKVLTSSVKDLAELSWDQLATGLIGTIGLLMGLILVVQHMPNDKKLFATAISLNVLALAVKLLASSVIDLAGLDWNGLAIGLTGVGAVLGALFLFTKFMEADKGGIAQGAGLLLLAGGVRILADAVGKFADLSWEEIGRGLAAMAGGLALVAAALYSLPQTSLLSAISVLLVALTLDMIADSVGQLAGVSWEGIAKGLVAVAGIITILGIALSSVPPTAPLVAIGFLIMAESLETLGKALKSMGGMSWEEIGKGLVVLAGSLTIIAIAMAAMTEALLGAAALLVVAASLAIMVPILQAFGAMDWEAIAKAGVVLTGLFTILGIAGAVLTPVVPTLIGLGAAILLLGAAMLAAGVGILAFSIGLKTLSVLGAEGAETMKTFITTLLDLIPLVAAKIGEGVIAFAAVISTAGPAITEAITVVLIALLDSIEQTSPKIIALFFKLLTLLLKTMETAVPQMYRSGLKILIGVLEGIRDNIGQIVTVALQIIANFIKGVGKGLPDIIEAGVQLILSFIRGLTKAINDHAKEMGEAGGDLAVAIINGMIKGLGAGVGKIADKAREVAGSALDAAKKFLGINSPSKEFEKVGIWSGKGMELGLDKSSDGVSSSAEAIGKEAVLSLRKSMSSMAERMAIGELDLSPTITPVVDITDAQKAASVLDGLFSINPISVKTTYSGATAASDGFQSNQDAQNNTGSGSTPTSVTYNQTINSPKAISTAEVYRQTKNQLSTTREVVEPNAVQSRST